MTIGDDAMDEIGTMPLGELARFDFRAAGRDPVDDARAVEARVDEVLDAVDMEDWETPLSASDVVGAAPWTLADHLTHVAAWDEEAIAYTGRAIAGEPWPTDDDYGDTDAWNEEHRAPDGWTPVTVRERLTAAHEGLVDVASRLPADLAGSDGAWEWVWPLVQDHVIDHLALLDDGEVDPAEA